MTAIPDKYTMTVQPPSMPPIVPRLDETEREDDIPSDNHTSVDETSSSRDRLSRDIERE